MKQWKHTKRCIAMLLAVVMTSSLVQNGLVGLVRAVERELPSMSAGEVVANTYKDSLKAWELNILKSGYLTGDTITYKAPAANESGLVTVDTENKTVTVKNYKDANGNVWKPGTTAKILVDGKAMETINLENGKGTFEYAGNAYDVSVDYTLTTKVDKELQKQLLSAPYWIAKGVNNLDVLNGSAVKSGLDLIVSDANKNLLETFANEMKNGAYVFSEARPIAAAMLAEMDENGGKLKIQLDLEAYDAAASKTQYLLEHGDAMKADAKRACQWISAIHTQLGYSATKTLATLFAGVSEDIYDAAVNAYADLVEAMEPAANDDWAILDHKDIIRTDLTAAEYVLLDTYATAGGEDLASYKNHDALVKSENLKVAKQTVVCNLNRYIVTVQIAANVIDNDTIGSDTTTQKTHTSVALTLNSGATGADILAELEKNGAEAKALESWTAFGVNTENYTRTLSVDMDGFVLSEDTTLTITYTPKELTVSGVEGMPETVPYGYQLRLPVHQDSEKVWDYTVNGKYEDQGAVIRITDDTTITRVEGAAWEYHKVNEIIAQYTNNTAVKEILANAALKGDTIRLRVPSGKELSLAGNTVTASAYPANQSGLVWIPVSGTLLGGNNAGDTITFEHVNNKYQATLDTNDYEQIQVNYQLSLNWDTLGKTQQEALSILNLPYVLTQEAAQQMGAMNKLVDQQGNLNTLGDNMGMISSIVRGDKNLGDAAKAAMDEVYEKCFKSSEKKLYLQTYVAGYAAASTEAAKLAYYYENYGDLHEQVETLYKNLEILVNDPAFESVIPDEYKEYTDKINDIVEKFKDILDDMVAPNEALDLNHANLNALLTAVTANIGRLEERTEQLEEPTMSAKPTVEAPDKVIIKVNIYIKDGNGAVLKSDVISWVKSFDNPAGDAFMMTQNVWNELVQEASEKGTELLRSIDIDPKLAGELMEVSELGEFGGFEELKTNKTYTVTYQYKRVDQAPVHDENGNMIGGQMSYDNPKVNLPECEEEGFRYEYALYDDNGEFVKKITGKSYTFEVVELVKGYYIGRTVIDEHRQAILNLVDELNQNLWDNGATYTYNGKTYQSVVLVPVEKDGQLTLVLRINPNGLKINGGMAMDTVMTFTNTNVYMEANGQVIKGNQMIGLQGLLDALLSSGLGTDSFVGAVNANGTINEIKVEGEFVGKNQDYIESIELFGGKLAELDMKMGLNAEKARDVKVLVTLENFGRDTGSMSNTYSSINSIRSYLDVSLKNGNLHLDVKIPERGYQAAIVALLALSETRLSDLSSVQVENLTQMIYELIVPVIKDETVDSQTLINTLNSMKISTANLDLSFYDELAPALRKILPDDPTDYGETVGDTYKLTLSYDIKNVINKLGLPELVMNMIDGTNLHMTFALQLRNLNKTFSAMVIDPKASGANILRFYSDVESLQSALNNRSYTSLVILLDDIEGDLTINNKGVVLDLNGHTINGSLIANASTTVVNSNMAADGCVTGHVKGNVKLTTGIYHEDVSKFLPAGYVQEDGKVVNKYFEVKQDANGDYTVLIKIENALEETKVPSLQAMALEAAYTFILNQYQAASWSFGENMDIYALGYDDLAELLDGISTADGNKLLSVIKTDGITNFLNDFLANLTDFGKIAETGILAEYDVTTAPWAFRVEQNENENRLELGIVNGKTTTRHLTIKIDNTEKVKDLLNALDKVADIDISVKLDGIKVDGTVVSGGGSARIDAVIDMTRNPNYGLVAAIMVANQINDGRRAELIKAIEHSIETGDTMALKSIMDRVTQAELLTALKNTKRDQFQNILNSLNIQNADKVAQLEAVYDDVLFLGGQLLGALKINGSSLTLDAFEKGFSTYEFNAKPNGKTNINVGGITIALNGSAEINVSIKLFKETPVLGGQIFNQNTETVKNFWFESDENDVNYSLIESCPNGMTVDDFKTMMANALKNVYSEYDRIIVNVDSTNTLIHTGANVKITFEIDGYTPVDMEFTMVVMGDSNGDGRIDENDSVTIKEKFVNGEELTGAYLKAADGNGNQELDCGDCVLIESKYTYKWNEYAGTLAASN